ncbi:MAG TPA: formyltransferase family protein, partial [Polyangiaceae bacterium]|nr:formyltransferase family protein [Polyangiaceae bacterium]
MTLALGVLVSGTGTNLQAILDATRDGSLDARVSCVISNRTEAMALERAARAGVPALAIPHQTFDTRAAF